MSVLLDTGFLYAVLDAGDAHHEAAWELMAELERGLLGTACTTPLVVAEFMTLVRVRRGPPIMEQNAWALLQQWPGLRMLDVPAAALLAIQGRYASHPKLSFVDASLLWAMEEHAIDHLATFDRGLRPLCSTLPNT